MHDCCHAVGLLAWLSHGEAKAMSLTSEQRLEHAKEWRWWRKQSPAGARRAWRALKDWREVRHLEMRPMAALAFTSKPNESQSNGEAK